MGGKQKETTGECRAAIPHVSVACSAGRATKRQCWGCRAHICCLSSARLPERNVTMLRSHRNFPSLSWRVGERPHGPICPFTQQSHQTTSSSHPNTDSANGCSWRVILAHPWELMWPNAFWEDSPSQWI